MKPANPEKMCRLCESEPRVENSHIIPRFVSEQQKKTSSTGFFRKSESINRRSQDGFKAPMLGKDCESMCNKWETPFATRIYHPWNTGKFENVEYGPWCLKFAASVSWRCLTQHMDISRDKVTRSQEALALINKALLYWRNFMLGRRPHPGPFQQHMILFDAIERMTDKAGVPSNMNRFLTRGLHIDLAHYQGHPLFIFTKMGKVALFGFIGISHPHQWIGTQIHVKGGTLGGGISVPKQLWDYLVGRAHSVQEEYDRISERQKEKIAKTIEDDMDRFAESETLEMMRRDVEMFGKESVFREKQGS